MPKYKFTRCLCSGASNLECAGETEDRRPAFADILAEYRDNPDTCCSLVSANTVHQDVRMVNSQWRASGATAFHSNPESP